MHLPTGYTETIGQDRVCQYESFPKTKKRFLQYFFNEMAGRVNRVAQQKIKRDKKEIHKSDWYKATAVDGMYASHKMWLDKVIEWHRARMSPPEPEASDALVAVGSKRSRERRYACAAAFEQSSKWWMKCPAGCLVQGWSRGRVNPNLHPWPCLNQVRLI